MKKVPYNPVAREMNKSRKAKKFADRRDRRAKDARKHWKNEEH